jgi:gamma-glutamyltranspeptidase/glutathione hydrolase
VNWDFPYLSRRVPVLAGNCVATSQPLASQAGLAMLARGGTAVDAAIAAAITLTVVEPVMNGIGSDAFAIVWDGKELAGLNGSGRAPLAWSPNRFPGAVMPEVGWDTVTVPGAVSAWAALHGRFGRLAFEDLFEPAVRYARDGCLVPPAIARRWESEAIRLDRQPGFAETFLTNGRAPKAGELFRCPDQVETLLEIARTRGESFYRGRLAERIGHAAAKTGGVLTAEDLAAHAADWVTPIDVAFRGHRIHELPPNGQGIAALVALGVLERCDLSGLAADSPEMLHLQAEATKLGLADVRTHVADPDFMQVTAAELLDPGRLAALAAAIRRDRTAAPQPQAKRDSGTVYLAAADAAGMMVSFIQSNYSGFGSGVVVPGTGIALNNRGSCFVTTPGHPNQVGPGKRPLHTIIPGFMTKDGAALTAFGVMGAEMQPQGHVQVVSRMLVSNQNPQAAIDAPRWRVVGDELWIEEQMPQEARRGLAARGHRLTQATDLDFGAAQIIRRVDGGYVAGSESRRDGCAVGF